MNARTAASRIATLVAALATTALIIGSQLGIAGNYTAEADAVLAAQRAAPVAKTAGGAAPQARRV